MQHRQFYAEPFVRRYSADAEYRIVTEDGTHIATMNPFLARPALLAEVIAAAMNVDPDSIYKLLETINKAQAK